MLITKDLRVTVKILTCDRFHPFLVYRGLFRKATDKFETRKGPLAVIRLPLVIDLAAVNQSDVTY